MDSMETWDDIEKRMGESLKAKKIKESHHESLEGAFNRIAVTEDGKLIFKYLASLMLMKESTLAVSPRGRVDIETTLMNESRRMMWLDLRKFFNIENRHEIEKDI